MKKSIYTHIGLSFLLLLIVFSCSQDRLTPLNLEGTGTEKIVDFNPVLNYNVMESLNKSTEKFTINSQTDLPYTTKKGTKIWLYDYNLQSSTGQAVKYPFDIEIIELFTLKDMVLYNKPTMSNEQLLSTDGAFYIKAFQNKKELKMGIYPRIDIPSKQTDNAMTIFYEVLAKNAGLTNDRMTWQKSDFLPIDNGVQQRQAEAILFGNKNAYQIFPSQYGWINCDKFYNFLGEKTKIEFKSTYPEIKNMMIFMVIPRINSVLAVYDGVSAEIPIGETVKVVAVAKSVEGEYYTYFTDFTSASGKIIDFKLSASTEADFLAKLDKL
jgi:hypothetical protein